MLPLQAAAVDVVCNIFTQLHVDEMQRVLKPGGHVLLVTPAPEHLLSIREQLFDEVRDYDASKFLSGFDNHFAVQSQQQLNFPMRLDQQTLKQLLLMTPYAWRAKQERRLALEANEAFDTQAAFSVTLLQKLD
jgi:23S rRNA (guanine745-N1)-methyltransferase